MPGWTKVKQGAEYAGVSERTFRPWLKDGLRHIRLRSGTVLTKYEWIDEFLGSFEVMDKESERIDEIVTGVLDRLHA